MVSRAAGWLAIAMAIASAACQGQSSGGGGGGSAGSDAPKAPADATEAVVVADAGEADARTKPLDPDPEPPDPGRVIADLGAIPAWQAVVDRAQLLGRRGQHGIVYGRVGPAVLVPAPAVVAPAGGVGAGAGSAAGSAAPRDAGAGAGSAALRTTGAGSAGAGSAGLRNAGAGAGAGSAAPSAADAGVRDAGASDAGVPAGVVASPYVWLIDDTEGNGSLGIRVALGDRAKLGDRVALGGAWQLDEQRRWYWKPDSVQPLPPAPVSELKEPQPAVPVHAIVNGELPSGARTISVARDGDLVYFQIVGPAPTSDGDGWQVADQLGSPTIAVMNLPGERASYGGQDMRGADERWQLKRGQTYWVRIGKLRKRGADKPPLVNARTAPVRVL